MLSSILNHFGRLSIEHGTSLDLQIYKCNSTLHTTSWSSSITEEDGLSTAEPTFSNQILKTNHILKTPKVGDQFKKLKYENVTPKRVAKKYRDSMTNTEKTKESY